MAEGNRTYGWTQMQRHSQKVAIKHPVQVSCIYSSFLDLCDFYLGLPERLHDRTICCIDQKTQSFTTACNARSVGRMSRWHSSSTKCLESTPALTPVTAALTRVFQLFMVVIVTETVTFCNSWWTSSSVSCWTSVSIIHKTHRAFSCKDAILHFPNGHGTVATSTTVIPYSHGIELYNHDLTVSKR